MTIQRAIETARAQASTELSNEILVGWLSRLDGQLWQEVCSHYAGNEDGTMPSYDEDTDLEATELLAAAPYDELYPTYLCMRIHLDHGDIDRYNNSADQYNLALKAWQRHYNANHRYVNGKDKNGRYWVYGLRF